MVNESWSANVGQSPERPSRATRLAPEWIRVADLTRQLVGREISQRYRGATLGAAWPVIQPLLLLGVYTFVFSVVFSARWPEFPAGTGGYPLAVFAGLITFGLIAEPVTAAPRLLLGYRELVNRVRFPLEILPVVKVFAALLQALIGLIILVAASIALGGAISPMALLLPVLWLPLLLLGLGSTYLLSALGIWIRDLEQLVGFAMTALLFGSAIFYPLAQVPDSARAVLQWLPTAAFIESTRALLFHGVWDWGVRHSILALACLAVAALGFAAFRRGRPSFADVL